MILRVALLTLITLTLTACGSKSVQTPDSAVDRENRANSKTPTRKPNVVLKRGGGFYKDDGPGDDIPDGLDDIPDAEPRLEPLHRPALRPYVVLGKEYVPNTAVVPYKARGIASWYGKKFHGQKTSIGEPYDMFAMTAAHTTLALPSYVRVTSVQSGKSVIVRITDRGPFHEDRVIDLSYTAAYKLGLITGGSGQVEVEAIIPGETPDSGFALTPLPVRPLISAPATAQLTPNESSPPGIYLQLGAFANLENAENLRTHLRRELDWVNESMRINAGGGIHRLQLGPYATRDDANRIAEKIRDALGYRPSLVMR